MGLDFSSILPPRLTRSRLTAVPAGQVSPGSKAPMLSDTCGCLKLADAVCRGREGWHYRLFDESDVQREITKALSLLPPGSPDSEREAVERSARQFATRYLGSAMAYEPCPAYRAAAKREIADKRRREGKADLHLIGSDL